jgi:hypothetical protein
MQVAARRRWRVNVALSVVVLWSVAVWSVVLYLLDATF